MTQTGPGVCLQQLAEKHVAPSVPLVAVLHLHHADLDRGGSMDSSFLGAPKMAGSRSHYIV